LVDKTIFSIANPNWLRTQNASCCGRGCGSLVKICGLTRTQNLTIRTFLMPSVRPSCLIFALVLPSSISAIIQR